MKPKGNFEKFKPILQSFLKDFRLNQNDVERLRKIHQSSTYQSLPLNTNEAKIRKQPGLYLLRITLQAVLLITERKEREAFELFSDVLEVEKSLDPLEGESFHLASKLATKLGELEMEELFSKRYDEYQDLITKSRFLKGMMGLYDIDAVQLFDSIDVESREERVLSESQLYAPKIEAYRSYNLASPEEHISKLSIKIFQLPDTIVHLSGRFRCSEDAKLLEIELTLEPKELVKKLFFENKALIAKGRFIFKQRRIQSFLIENFSVEGNIVFFNMEFPVNWINIPLNKIWQDLRMIVLFMSGSK